MSTPVPDLVSTIIPVYNRPEMLREAVASVLAQTYRPVEVIVIDDGSTDDTREVADALASGHPEVQALHVGNGGAGLARESGRQEARGEFIQYLDSDDLLHPSKFEVLVAALRGNPSAGVAYGVTRLVDGEGRVLESPYKRTAEGLTHLYPTVLVERWWNTHTPLYRRAVCDAVGPWTGMRMAEDWEYDARVGELGTELVHCPEELSDTRRHDDGKLTGGELTPAVLRDLARLLPRLRAGAALAGVGPSAPELRRFVRWAFLVARQCGAQGLVSESRKLFGLAREVAEECGTVSWQFGVYGTLSRLVGWEVMGRLADATDRLRGSAAR